MGATVLHEDAIFPVRQAGIPINIKNTNSPEDKGTIIVEKYMSCAEVYNYWYCRKEGLCSNQYREGYDESRDWLWKKGT